MNNSSPGLPERASFKMPEYTGMKGFAHRIIEARLRTDFALVPSGHWAADTNKPYRDTVDELRNQGNVGALMLAIRTLIRGRTE